MSYRFSNPFIRLWSSYLYQLHHRPILVNSLISTTVLATGDSIAQLIEYRTNHSNNNTMINNNTVIPAVQPAFEFNTRRILSMGFWGLLTGFPMYRWYVYLDSKFPIKSLSTIIPKIIINQSTFAVAMNVTFYGYCVAIDPLRTGPLISSWYSKLQSDIVLTTVNSFKLWSIVHLFNFYFIPNNQRVLFQSIIGCGWCSYLSIIGHREQLEEELIIETIEELQQQQQQQQQSSTKAIDSK